MAYFFGVVGRIASHDDTHRPDKVETDVRTADTFACLAFIEVGVQRTQNQFAGILVDRIVYIDASQIRHSQQTGDIGIVHENVVIETVCFEGIYLSEFGVFYNTVFLDGGSYFVGQ